jgi:FtsP/CotA-like multicopper oxidase with cupredoxin domain
MIHPEPWSGSLDLATLEDTDPDPDIVEVSLVARPGELAYLPGRASSVWTYNGSVPGPVLRARLGDRVIIHFQNDLPEPTTIHWHGLRVPNDMDGTHRVMEPVAAGGTHRYEFTVLDAGTFWFHPHVRTDVQVAKGLYGAIVVTDEAAASLPAVADELLLLNDVLIDEETGEIDDTLGARAQMMGREGNLVLVNGARSNVEITARAGEWRRWRIVNTANARYFRIGLADGRMVRIGGDVGLLERPEEVSDVLLTPGERAEVLVAATQPGQTAILRALPYERAEGAGATEAVDLVRIVASQESAAVLPELPASLRTIPTLADPMLVRSVRLGERMEHGHMVFTINDVPYPELDPFVAQVGTVEAWDLVNETDMDHPFHLHGFHFQADGIREWKDTVNIPSEQTSRILVDLREHEGARGTWMVHCHILEHEEGGMMAELEVR